MAKNNRILSNSNLGHAFFPWLVCGLGALFYCYEYLLRVSPSVMSAQVITFLHTDDAGFGVLAGSYFYIYAVMQLFVGVLLDTYGPRRLMTLACCCCAFGIMLFAVTNNYYIALIGRSFIGFGSAFAFVGVLKLTSIWLPQKYFALMSGLTTALGMLGGILGDLVLTLLVQRAGWRMSCFYAGVVGLILAAAIFFVIKRARVYYLRRRMPKEAPNIKRNFAKLIELLKNKYIWFNGIIAGGLFMSLPVFADTWGIPYFTQSLHYSHETAAMMVSTIYLGWAIGAPVSGWLTDYIQRRRIPLLVGSVLSLLVTFFILYISNPTESVMYMLCFLLGVFSSVQVIGFAVARDLASVEYTGSAVALTNMLIMISGWFVVLVGFILKGVSQPGKEGAVVHYSQAHFDVALSILPIALIVAIFFLFFMRETHPDYKSEISG